MIVFLLVVGVVICFIMAVIFYLILRQVVKNTSLRYNRFNADAYIQGVLNSEMKQYIEILDRIDYNRYLFKEYWDDICVESFSTHRSWIYQRIEDKLFRKISFHPILDFSAKMEVRYISPKGRNSYFKYYLYDYKHISYCIDDMQRREDFEIFKEYQRNLMSDQLRYEILRRDNFRCVLCGQSAKDGAKLHVDHIYPVSRGGETIPSNLRTLCDRCNLGKGARIE